MIQLNVYEKLIVKACKLHLEKLNIDISGENGMIDIILKREFNIEEVGQLFRNKALRRIFFKINPGVDVLSHIEEMEEEAIRRECIEKFHDKLFVKTNLTHEIAMELYLISKISTTMSISPIDYNPTLDLSLSKEELNELKNIFPDKKKELKLIKA